MPGSEFPLPQRKQLDILLIESNEADTRLTIEALKQAGLDKKVRSMKDGDEALAYLRREGKHSGTARPDLIFLDLDLPRVPGLEVLTEIKTDPKLRCIPVLVVSGSNNPYEIREAYELHASCFIGKRGDLHEFFHFIQVCYEFWGSVVTLPPKLGSPEFG
jgi:two-component system, chemotaxis family, response regulator Rcp1